MAAMTTVLTVFSQGTYTTSGHTVQKPKLVLQKRRVPTGNQVVAEDVITVLHGAEDSNGVILDSKVAFSASVRRHKDAIAADVAAALVIFRDIVAGDEFGNTVDTQEPLG